MIINSEMTGKKKNKKQKPKPKPKTNKARKLKWLFQNPSTSSKRTKISRILFFPNDNTAIIPQEKKTINSILRV